MDFNLSQDLDDINEQETCQVISQNHTIFDHMSPNSQRFFKLLITKPDQNPDHPVQRLSSRRNAH